MVIFEIDEENWTKTKLKQTRIHNHKENQRVKEEWETERKGGREFQNFL